MTNKEWLEMVKKEDEENLKTIENDMVVFVDEMNTTNELRYRQAKALEIIAEELIKLNENFGLLEKVYDKSEKAIRVTND